jgi:hypothetical protein
MSSDNNTIRVLLSKSKCSVNLSFTYNVVECDIVIIKFVIAIIIDWRWGSLGCMLVSRWCETGSVLLSISLRVTIGGSDGCLEASKIDASVSRTWGLRSRQDGRWVPRQLS